MLEAPPLANGPRSPRLTALEVAISLATGVLVLEGGKKGPRGMYRSERREKIGIEALLHPDAHSDGRKTDRKVSPEGRRKLRHPLAFTPLRHKSWKK